MVKGNSVADAVQKLMTERFETFGERCPMCGTPLLRPKTRDRNTGQKMPGACPNTITYEVDGKLQRKSCGYMQPINRHRIPDAVDLTLTARKNDALGYLNSYSVFSNFDVFNHRFENFNVDNVAEKQVLTRCENMASKIINGEIVHSVLMGKTGRGKTHLAIGIMYYIFERTQYQKKILVTKNGKQVTDYVARKIMFVDWRELVEQKKQAISDEQMNKQVNKTTKEFKNADIVILDDFGSERETDYSRDLADGFWRDREDKTVIVTTNLTGNDLNKRYSPRLMSRMKKHGVKQGIAFSGLTDYRG
ncbi:ATP-binding protein [Lactiplantibacillus plantarum]